MILPKCYHKKLKTTFNVVFIDTSRKFVRVVKMLVKTGSEYTEAVMEDYPLGDVDILYYSPQVDDQQRPIMEGDLVAYGDNLVCTGRVSRFKREWMLNEMVDGQSTGKRYNFLEADPKLLHIIETRGNL